MRAMRERIVVISLLVSLALLCPLTSTPSQATSIVEAWRGGAFVFPVDVSTDPTNGSVWVADRDGNAVVHLDSDGTELWRGSGLSAARAVSVNSADGSCWSSISGSSEVVHLSSDGTELWRGGGFNNPCGLAVNPADGSCWVADRGNNEVVHLSEGGVELWRGGGFDRPLWVSVNELDGSCWVADRHNNAIVHLAEDGTELWRGSGFDNPQHLSVNPTDGTCWVVDWGNSQIVHLAEDGTELWRGGAVNAPRTASVDPADGSCWVGDRGNNQIVLFAEDGTELWRVGGFNLPIGTSANPTDGGCWVGDSANGQVVRLTYSYTLSLTGSNGQVKVDGVTEPLPWSGDFLSGDQVALEAIPDATYEFSGWSGDLSGNDNPTSVTMDSDASITATFSKIQYTLNLSGTGNGTALVDGVEQSLPWSGVFDIGSVVALEAIPGSCYEFQGWSGDLSGSANPTSITMDGHRSVAAAFAELEYSLTLTGVGSGSVLVDGTPQSLPWSGSFTCGSSVSLEALAGACYAFSSWSGDLSGGVNPTSITMDGAKSVTAVFVQLEYTLSLTSAGNGSVLVDGTPQSLPWSGSFLCGSSVTVEAVPDDCWAFDRWSGDVTGSANPITVTVNDPTSIKLWFEQIQYTLEIVGVGEGTVMVDGKPRSRPWSAAFDCGSAVVLEAVPDACYEFGSWGGDLSGSDNPVLVVMDGPKAVTADFAKIEYTLSLTGEGGSVTVDGVSHALPWSGSVECGATVSLGAAPDSCHEFSEWSGNLSGSENPATVVMDANKSVAAGFVMLTYMLSIAGDGEGQIAVDGVSHALPWSGVFDCGTSVTLEALADTCAEFAGWSGDLSGGENPALITVDGGKTVTALFSQAEHTLSLTGSGGVVVVDGTPALLPWSGVFACGSSVTLEAVADEHREFSGWSGDLVSADNPATITMDGEKAIAVTFSLVQQTVTVTGTGSGSIRVDGVAESLPWSGVFDYGSEVSLEAVAADGWKFYKWEGGVVGRDNPVVLAVGSDVSVHAVFIVEVTFDDIADDNWAAGAIEALTDAGIVSGYPDGQYRPDLEVDRGSMAVYVARAVAGSDENVPEGPGEATFPDVGTDHWAYRYVEYVVAVGIVTGYPDGSYHPEWLITRGQMSVYISRAIAEPIGEAGLDSYVTPLTPSFRDVPEDYWCFKYVEYLVEAAVAFGYPDGNYYPTRRVTRDQMAVYISRGFGFEM